MSTWTITVKPNSRQEKVEFLGERQLKVSVNAPPVEGKANEAVVRLVAKHLGVPRSRVKITAGAKGKKKRLEVED